MRQLPEQCESCKRQTATLETCVLPDGTEKRGAEVTVQGERRGRDQVRGVRGRGPAVTVLLRRYRTLRSLGVGRIAFEVTAGTTYRIAVAGEGAAEEGTFELGLDMAPEVTATKPADGAVKVSRSANVSATFSEPMDAGSINTTSFRLVRQGAAAPVSAAVTYDAVTKTAKLDPGPRLKRGALYTATVTTGARDQAGSPLAQSETWGFKVRRR